MVYYFHCDVNFHNRLKEIFRILSDQEAAFNNPLNKSFNSCVTYNTLIGNLIKDKARAGRIVGHIKTTDRRE